MKFPTFILLACLSVSTNAEEKSNLLGKDLTDWTFITQEGEKPAQAAWKLEDGVLSTTGEPIGYLRTKETYKDYTLNIEWRWQAGTEQNNSGVLVHVSTPGAAGVWPKSFEAQLMQANAGDFWMIGEKLEATGENKGGRWIRIADPKEKPVGEWNTMTVKCTGEEIVVHVNGVHVNSAKNLSVNEGAIAFQAEGKPVEIRNITITR